MHRILLTGLGLAAGVFASPAAAQYPRPNAPAPERTARLGRPVAVPDNAPVDSRIRPVGLLTPRQSDSGVPTPMPTPSALPASPPVAMPRIVTGPTPNVTEDRGFPSAQPGPSYPVPMQGVPTLVPSVAPPGGTFNPGGGLNLGGGYAPGGSFPQGGTFIVPPGADCPIQDGVPLGVPGLDAAVGRVAGCGRWYGTSEYLMWWTQRANVPPLVTTSSPQFFGQLGNGDTQTLVEGPFGQTMHSGFRIGGGWWFTNNEVRGVDARIFFLNETTSNWTATSNQHALLARPFFNVNPNTAPENTGSTSQIIADLSRGATGGVVVSLANSVWGAEANYRRFLMGNPCARLDGIVGYRYLNIQESLTITENFARPLSTINGGFPAITGTVYDSFSASNDFHGGQIGLIGELRRGRWTLDGRATVAFGNLTQTLTVSGGQSLITANGMRVTDTGGLLAVPGANIGRYTNNVFAVVPEVGLNVGFQLTQRMKLFVGYNFLYLGNALRPGAAIDTSIDAARVPNFLFPDNPGPIPGTPQPQPLFKSSEFFIQGISFGMQFNW